MPIFDVHTVHVHGGHVLTQVDGVPETSWGVPVTLPGTPAISVTYLFKPDHPGTFFYHCHQEASEHVQMGMYGALNVYPSVESLAAVGIYQSSKTGRWYHNLVFQPQIPVTATNRNFAYDDINTFFNSDWVVLLSDVDSRWHDAVLTDAPFNPVDYKPDYWGGPSPIPCCRRCCRLRWCRISGTRFPPAMTLSSRSAPGIRGSANRLTSSFSASPTWVISPYPSMSTDGTP
ncbi:MAG TPA: multicopper oxidase domain-containing protein [Bacillota bacterium]|jgi:hypothetical protein